jgi:hypothetical protein
MAELAEVVARPKFDVYLRIDVRQDFVHRPGEIAALIPITRTTKPAATHVTTSSWNWQRQAPPTSSSPATAISWPSTRSRTSRS